MIHYFSAITGLTAGAFLIASCQHTNTHTNTQSIQFCYCGKNTYYDIYLLNKFFKCAVQIANFRAIAVEQSSRNHFPCIIETLFPLIINLPLPVALPLTTAILLSDSMSLTNLETSCKGNLAVLVKHLFGLKIDALFFEIGAEFWYLYFVVFTFNSFSKIYKIGYFTHTHK